MSLFDATDLQDYLGSAFTVDPVQASILDTVVTALIQADLGYDPTPSPNPFTISLSLNDDHTVLLPRLLETVLAVQANGIGVRYFQHGNTLTVATATLPISYWLVWVNDRTVTITYTYTKVPAPLMAAALLTAATMLRYDRAGAAGSTVGLKSEQIDDYQAAYQVASEIFGPNGLPLQASALLRPYRRSPRSVKLRA